jgi:hypothetical protein
MSVEGIQDSLDKVVVAFSAALTRSTPDRELYDSMTAELEQIEFAYLPDGRAFTNAANAIILVCDRVTVVTKYVTLFGQQFQYGNELGTAMDRLRAEIADMRLRYADKEKTD